jgi:hypothetical protein
LTPMNFVQVYIYGVPSVPTRQHKAPEVNMIPYPLVHCTQCTVSALCCTLVKDSHAAADILRRAMPLIVLILRSSSVEQVGRGNNDSEGRLPFLPTLLNKVFNVKNTLTFVGNKRRSRGK